MPLKTLMTFASSKENNALVFDPWEPFALDALPRLANQERRLACKKHKHLVGIVVPFNVRWHGEPLAVIEKGHAPFAELHAADVVASVVRDDVQPVNRICSVYFIHARQLYQNPVFPHNRKCA